MIFLPMSLLLLCVCEMLSFFFTRTKHGQDLRFKFGSFYLFKILVSSIQNQYIFLVLRFENGDDNSRSSKKEGKWHQRRG